MELLHLSRGVKSAEYLPFITLYYCASTFSNLCSGSEQVHSAFYGLDHIKSINTLHLGFRTSAQDLVFLEREPIIKTDTSKQDLLPLDSSYRGYRHSRERKHKY